MKEYTFALRSLGLQGVRTFAYVPGGRIMEVGDSGVVVPASNDVALNFSSRMDTGGDTPQMSYFGYPVWANVILKTVDGSTELNIDNVLVDVQATKQIIKTSVQGRNGSIKEYIADGDLSINLKGLLFNPSMSNYPRAEVATLLQLLKRSESLKIISEYLQLFGVSNIVVDSYSLNQKQGCQNIQPFEIRCSSDTDAALIIKEGE